MKVVLEGPVVASNFFDGRVLFFFFVFCIFLKQFVPGLSLARFLRKGNSFVEASCLELFKAFLKPASPYVCVLKRSASLVVELTRNGKLQCRRGQAVDHQRELHPVDEGI